jgi:hypothetical protein
MAAENGAVFRARQGLHEGQMFRERKSAIMPPPAHKLQHGKSNSETLALLAEQGRAWG